ncbi:MAG: translocation/assembly module TamB [Planctomycetes bacterium]|jgi:hypothetical protein|nr:translocation/assembly module TamB [Planctomycetota bacterium]
MTPAPAEAPPRRPSGRWRRRLRWLAFGLLGGVLLVVGLWLFRQPLLVPLLRPRLEALLQRELAVDRVAIGGIGGSWFGAVELDGVVIESATGPLRELRGGRIALTHDLRAVLGGDLAGLQLARVDVAEATLDLRPAPGAAAPAEAWSGWPELAPFEPLLRLFPDGLELRVERLRLIAPHGERNGELVVGLQPAAAAAARALTVAFDGLDAEVQLPGSLAALAGAEPARVTIEATDPGGWFDAFAPALGVRGGTLRAKLGTNWPPTAVAATVELESLVYDQRTLSRSRIEARFADDRLRIDQAVIDLPGLALELREFVLARPFAGDDAWRRELAGRFVLRIDDLTPHAALLPAEVRERLPIRGSLAGAVEQGILQLEASSLQAVGVTLSFAQGTLPLVSDDWRTVAGSLRMRAELAEFALALPELGPGFWNGRIDATVDGTVTAPRLLAELALTACRCERGSIDGCTGAVRAERESLAVSKAEVLGLRLPWLGSGAPSRLGVDARCGLRDGAFDLDTLVAAVELDSELPTELLAPVFAAQGLGAPPAGSMNVAFAARHDAAGLAVERLSVRSAAGAPIALAIDGAGVVPLHWSGGSALQALTTGEFTVQVKAARAAVEDPFAVAGTLAVAAEKLSLRDLVAQLGPCRVTGEAQAAFGLGDWLAGRELGARTVGVALDVDELDLQQLPAAWFAPVALHGRAGAELRADGPLRELAPRLRLTIADGALHDGISTVLDDIRLVVGIDVDAEAARTLRGRVELSALVPVDDDLRRLGLGPELRFLGTVLCTDRGTELAPTVLRLGDGELALELRSSLRRSDLLAGTFGPADTTIDGRVGLRRFALDRLPPRWIPLGDCKGDVDGELRIGGTFANPGPEWLRGASLSLRDGELKLDGVPRFEQLTARIDSDERTVTLQSLSGQLGAGRFTAHGTLTQPRSLVADPFGAAAVDLQLVGDDLLLFRGDGARVRASVRAHASGTPDRLALGGEVVLGRGSKYVRRISILPDLNRRGGKAADDGLQLPALPPGIGERLQLDLAVRTAAPFEVRANVFEGDLDVAARLRGSGSAPRLEGTMATRNGLFRFPGANLRLTAGLLTFQPDEPRFPTLAVQAEGKRMGITVAMSVTGRYDRPEVQLTSVPPLPPQDLVVLLTTGQLPSTLAAQGAEGQARFVGSYLAKEVFESYLGSDSTERGAGMFDRLTIEAGREVSRNGTESVLIEYSLTPRFAVQAERDAFEDYNLGLVLRFRFR